MGYRRIHDQYKNADSEDPEPSEEPKPEKEVVFPDPNYGRWMLKGGKLYQY